jgi:prevent-host-death family protein
MPSVTIRDLSRNTSEVIDGVRETGRPAFVTRNGRPVAVLTPLNEEDLEDYLLATHPEIIQSIAEAERDIAAGRTISFDDLFASIDNE